jgi:hypothetical protein
VRLTVRCRCRTVAAAAKRQKERRGEQCTAQRSSLSHANANEAPNERDIRCLTCEIIACIISGGVGSNPFERL